MRFWLAIAASSCALSPAWATETQTYKYDALGRLTSVQSSGSVNNGQAQSSCFDPAGNRTVYKSDSSGALATCNAGPPNQPPVANPDATTIPRCGNTYLNVTANDTDPEGNLPLTVIGVTPASGLSLGITSSSTILIESTGTAGTRTFTYTVSDSLGATAIGTVTVSVTTANWCDL